MPSAQVWRVAVLAVSLTAAWLAVAQVATAGTYTVRSCGAAPGFSSQAFGDFATRGMRVRRACNPQGHGLRGLLVGNVPRPGRVAFRARSILTMVAPRGAHFKRYEWSGDLRRRDCGYSLQIYAEGPKVGRYEIKNRKPRKCPPNAGAHRSHHLRPTSYPVGTDQGGPNLLVQRVDCRSRDGCSASGENYVRTTKASAEIVDYTPPNVQITGGALASGAWVRGDQAVEYTASDNVGVKDGSAVIGPERRGPVARACDYTQLVPCANGPAAVGVDTTTLAEGSQPLMVEATDSAGNTAQSQPVAARVDNTPPARVNVAAEGGEGWRRTADFALAWANPPEGDRAPIAAAHYTLCRSGTSECTSGRTGGEGIARLGLNVPSPGEYVAIIWREDAAGNQQSDNGSVPVTLRYDPEPPQPVFEPPQAADPTHVSVKVTDRVSGLAGGTIEIGRVGSGSWQALPTERQGDRLVARIDDARFPPGRYALRSHAADQAGNQASTDRRADGQPVVVDLPLRIASKMRAGVARRKIVRRRVGRRGRRRTVRRRVTVLDGSRRVRFGRRVQVMGTLVNRDGQGIGGAQVKVYSRTPVNAERLVGVVATDRRGRYRYTARASSTRTLRFAYAGNGLILPAQREVTLRVPAASLIRLSRGRVLNGQAVAFRGRLGAPAPNKLVELQVRLSGRFQTFRTTRTGPNGRWAVGYRFRRTCGRTRFAFRARLPKEASSPFETGRSRTVSVTVRGRPCAG